MSVDAAPSPPGVARSATEARELAAEAGRALEDAAAEEVVRWAVDVFGDRVCAASSMQDATLVHLASSVRPGIAVLFLDTGYHFPETLGMRDAVAATLPITLVEARPRLSTAEQDARYGVRLHDRSPDACCAMRKVEPLRERLAPYAAWITGLRRTDASSRRQAAVVAWDERFGIVKVNPMARWTDADVAAYVERYDVLVNPLVAEGYASIGCAPCTRAVRPGEDARAGRWSGRAKVECGLHA